MASPHRQADLEDWRGHRLALVLVDLQNDYCHPRGVFDRAGLRLGDRAPLVERVNRLATAARAGGHVVIWTRMVWDNDEEVGLLASRSPFLAHEGLRQGSWGAELLEELDVHASDRIVEKPRFSAFFQTDLESRLQEEDIRRLVLAGVRTDFCVESTVRDAFFRDIDVVVVGDAVAGYFPELHDHSLRVMNTVFARVLETQQAVPILEQLQSTHQEVT